MGLVISWGYTGLLSGVFYLGRRLRDHPDSIGWISRLATAAMGVVIVAAAYRIWLNPKLLLP